MMPSAIVRSCVPDVLAIATPLTGRGAVQRMGMGNSFTSCSPIDVNERCGRYLIFPLTDNIFVITLSDHDSKSKRR